MSVVYKPVRTEEEVTPEILERLYDIVEGWYLEEPFDWIALLGRLEEWCYIDLGTSMDSPAVKKIQREARKCKKENV